jgi:hypothetical protein
MNRLVHLGLSRGTYTFQTEYFDEQYRAFEQAFYDEYLVYDVIAPLHNILITGSVQLSDEFKISPLTDDDVDPARIAKTNLIRPESSLEGSQCAIRSTFRVQKIVGDNVQMDLSEASLDRRRFEETTARVDELINAMRLHGVETVYYSAIIFRTPEWLFSDEKVFPTRMRAPVPVVYQKNELWLRDFSKFWHLLQSEGIKKRKWLAVAIRRFGYALERPFNEDRLVDLMIACESLFLNDLSAQGELSYRLALRAAYLLGNDTAARTTVYHNVKQAYNFRSAVVHGSSRTIQIKDEHGEPVKLDQFLGIIQAYMHRALRLMIERAATLTPSQILFDWDALILNQNNSLSTTETHENGI